MIGRRAVLVAGDHHVKIRMKSTHQGSIDGRHPRPFVEGQEYDLGATQRELELAKVFIEQKWAEEVKAPAAQPIAAPVETPPAEISEAKKKK